MTLRFFPYDLQLRHRFTLALHSRTTTPVMLVEVEEDGVVGYGEASMPPYLGEDQESAAAFLSGIRLPVGVSFPSLDAVLKVVDESAPGNNAAKAALDIALHDWLGKKAGKSLQRIWGLDARDAPLTSLTIPIGDRREIERWVSEAADFPYLKVKLGGTADKETIETIRRLSDKPLRVDVNQGWQERDEALRAIEWLAREGAEFVEQPLPAGRIDDTAWLRERSPIPIVADESVKRLSDLRKLRGAFDAVNIKLMKCTGLAEARRMIGEARAAGLKILIGCMTETSCGISAAAQLAPLADWADLDGAVLIANDPFRGASIDKGRMLIPDRPGIGVVKLLPPQERIRS